MDSVIPVPVHFHIPVRASTSCVSLDSYFPSMDNKDNKVAPLYEGACGSLGRPGLPTSCHIARIQTWAHHATVGAYPY